MSAIASNSPGPKGSGIFVMRVRDLFVPSPSSLTVNLLISGLVAGKLFGPAELRTDKAGKPFVVAKVLAASGDGETLIVNVIGFESAVCSVLQALSEGEPIALAGGLTPRVWTDKQGNTRPALDMVAHRVLTAYDASDTHPV
jgi:hypothetical protein